MLVTISDYGCCHPFAQSGYVGEQMPAGGIYIGSDAVYAALDDTVERRLEFHLVNVILILPDTYRFGVYFYKFGKGIH